MAGLLSGVLAQMALDELDGVIALTTRIKEFDKRIATLARRQVPVLLELPGCGELTAAKLLGESAGITRCDPGTLTAYHAHGHERGRGGRSPRSGS